MAIYKDPNSERTYFVDWTAWLLTDTLASVTWDVPTGLTKITQTNTTKIAYVKLSSGVTGTYYNVVCHVVTAAGEKEDATLEIYIQER